jgi:hypothetical protein
LLQSSLLYTKWVKPHTAGARHNSIRPEIERNAVNALDHNTGIEIIDLKESAAFRSRDRHERAFSTPTQSLLRLSRIFATPPSRVLQELSDVAAQLCEADSAGVSLEDVDPSGIAVFRWAATSGEYSRYLNAMLPRVWMPCGVCLETMRPQLVRVPRDHFAAMGVEAAPITDGMLIPWQVDGIRGTIWILAHERELAFDSTDYQVMQTLADFAASAMRYSDQQHLILQQAAATSAAATANCLAHEINNPLQSVVNCLYLASQESPESLHLQRAMEALNDLSQL